MTLTELKRLRWVVLAVVLACIFSSVAMNVLHAPDNVWARFVGALPPLAVFGCLELTARIPSSTRWLTIVRIVGATIVAGGAAYLSYFQQFAAIMDLGFPHDQALIWPGVIDGTMIVASVSLVEVIRKIRQMTASDQTPKVTRVDVRDVQFETQAQAYREAAQKLGIQQLQVPAAVNGSKSA
jgi:peptidoglycan/LPS O-acetylase OafA/YrhL